MIEGVKVLNHTIVRVGRVQSQSGPAVRVTFRLVFLLSSLVLSMRDVKSPEPLQPTSLLLTMWH